MAKKRQSVSAAASKDDEPLTPVSKNDQPITSAKKNDPPPPSKKPEKEKVEEKDDEDSTSEDASSSEGEEDGESEDEESEEEEQPPSQPASKTAQAEKSESKNDEDDEEEEETDTDSDQEPPPKLKSINSKSIDQTLKSKPQPKSSVAPARSGTKRSAENDTKQADETKQSKKKKTTTADDKKEQGDDSKKLFQRVFNEDDELVILEGLVDFTVKSGTDPVKYPTAFYEDVKKSIHFPVTLEQLKDKVRRLKLKFENKMKSCKKGKTPVFSKPNEEKMFELGKQIWGGNVVEENGKSDEKPSKKGAGSSLISNEMNQFEKSISCVFGSGMDLLKRGADLLEQSKRIELEKRWKELQIDELKVFKMRAELAEEQGRFILDALMSSSSD